MKSFHDYSNEYACGGDRSYFTVSIPADEEIKHYQIKMVENNRIDLLLPLSVQRINDEWKLFFDITSKIPLGRVLERKPITQAAFLHIIRQIIKLTRELKDYLLDLSSVVLDTSYIFCDPSEFDLYFIYLPTEFCENEQNALKTFLKKLLVEDINLSEDSSGVILKRLLEVLKEDNLSVEKLYNCIEGREAVKKPLFTENSAEKNPVGQIKEDMTKQQNKIEIPGIRNSNTAKPAMSKPVIATDRPKQKELQVKSKEVNNKNIAGKVGFLPVKRSHLIIGIIDFVLLVAFIAMAASKSFGTTNVTGKITGMVMVFASINYFLITRLAGKEKNDAGVINAEKENKPAFKHFVNKEIEEDIILPQRPKKYADGKTDPLLSKSKAENKAEITVTAESSRKNEAPANIKNITKTVSDKTVVLGKAHASFFYLQNIACPTDRIKLDKESILIGRLEDSVDHVIHNNAVGKIHAELIEKDGQYFIADLNSVNGTYINGEKIMCNTPVAIKSGDKITFANESYTFIKV